MSSQEIYISDGCRAPVLLELVPARMYKQTGSDSSLVKVSVTAAEPPASHLPTSRLNKDHSQGCLEVLQERLPSPRSYIWSGYVCRSRSVQPTQWGSVATTPQRTIDTKRIHFQGKTGTPGCCLNPSLNTRRQQRGQLGSPCCKACCFPWTWQGMRRIASWFGGRHCINSPGHMLNREKEESQGSHASAMQGMC